MNKKKFNKILLYSIYKYIYYFILNIIIYLNYNIIKYLNYIFYIKIAFSMKINYQVQFHLFLEI